MKSLDLALRTENTVRCNFFFHGVYNPNTDTCITSCFTKQNSLGDKGEVQVACCGNPEEGFSGCVHGGGTPEGGGV